MASTRLLPGNRFRASSQASPEPATSAIKVAAPATANESRMGNQSIIGRRTSDKTRRSRNEDRKDVNADRREDAWKTALQTTPHRKISQKDAELQIAEKLLTPVRNY